MFIFRYDQFTGTFQPPVAGLYFFIVHAESSGTTGIQFHIMSGDKMLCHGYINVNIFETSSCAATVELNTDKIVLVEGSEAYILAYCELAEQGSLDSSFKLTVAKTCVCFHWGMGI